MATFPALTPNARSLSLGDYPQAAYTGPSGASVRFLQNTKRIKQTLVLTYKSLTETQINLLFSHYETQNGSLVPFDLPSEVWAGYDSTPISSVDYEWRYAASFSVEPSTFNRFDVTINLESVIA
jgi:hypothetical protein